MPPIRSAGGSDDPVLLSPRTLIPAVDPKAGVGPRGFWSYYARALAVGKSSDPKANGTFAAFTWLGVLYLNKRMPPWFRRLRFRPPQVPSQETAHPRGANRRATHLGRRYRQSALVQGASDLPDAQMQTRIAG